jgi:hypothetical protein
MTVEETLRQLAAAGHSRTSAHKAIGWSWYTFRHLAAEHPHIKWREPGQHMLPMYRQAGVCNTTKHHPADDEPV